MDFSVTRSLNDWAYRHGWAADLFRLLARHGVWLLVALVVALFLLAGHLVVESARGTAAAAGLATVVALGLGQAVSAAVDRSRPFVDHPGRIHLLIAHSRDAGFPSDHATGSFAIAAVLLAGHRRVGLVALALALAIAVSRVAVGAHYPTDVLAGAVLGGAAAVLVLATRLRRLPERAAALANALLP